MARDGLLRKLDAVTVPVPDLDSGIAFYCDALGHRLQWRNDDAGMAGLALPEGEGELVLTTEHLYEPNWLVDAVDAALAIMVDNGGTVVIEPFEIPVGRVAVVLDPFGNALTLIDLSKGTYTTDATGHVTGVEPEGPR